MVSRFPRVLETPARAAVRARTRGAEIAWPALRRLPGDSTRFGPPRGFVDSLPEWAAGRSDVDVRVVDEGTTLVLDPPMEPSLNPPFWFHELRDRNVFGTWVARMPHGRLVGSDPTVIGPDDTVFADLHNSWPKTIGYQKLTLRARLPKAERLAGTVAVAGARWGDNYTHWLLDVLPRLRLLGDDLKSVDHLVVQHGKSFQRDCLEAAGAPMDRLVEPDPAMHVVADELIVPSLVPRAGVQHLMYVQQLFSAQRSTAEPFRRLYLTRSNMWRRQTANEDEVVAALGERGFETVILDGLSVGEQARMFSEAKVVIGPNGSALANMIFAPPGSVMMEVFDENYAHPADWEIALMIGGSYHVFISPSAKSRSQWRDITIPLDVVMQALDVHGIR